MKFLISQGFKVYLLLPAGDGGFFNKVLRKMFLSLRYKVFVLGRETEPKNENRLESDSYDEYADFLVCIDVKKMEIIAGCRLIPASSGLPIQKGIKEKIHPKSFEISRMISNDTGIKCFLYSLIYQYAVERELEKAYIFARRGFLKILHKEGLNNSFLQIGPVYKHKYRRELILVPCVINVGDIPDIFKN